MKLFTSLFLSVFLVGSVSAGDAIRFTNVKLIVDDPEAEVSSSEVSPAEVERAPSKVSVSEAETTAVVYVASEVPKEKPVVKKEAVVPQGSPLLVTPEVKAEMVRAQQAAQLPALPDASFSPPQVPPPGFGLEPIVSSTKPAPFPQPLPVLPAGELGEVPVKRAELASQASGGAPAYLSESEAEVLLNVAKGPDGPVRSPNGTIVGSVW